MAEIAEKWVISESQQAEVERVLSTLVGVGHYAIGLAARHGCARAERIKVGARIAEHRPPGFFASLSKASAGEGDEILARVERLADTDAAIMAVRDFFVFTPSWRDVQETEVGPIIEDLGMLDSTADTLESVNTNPRILMEIEAFRGCVGDDKDSVNEPGTRLKGRQIAPAQALEELDRIISETQARTAKLIEGTLATDASVQGRHRYTRWKNVGVRLTATNAGYDTTYWSQDANTDIEYNPAVTIRLTANSAGVDLEGLLTLATGVLTVTSSSAYLPSMYLNQYLSDDVDEADGGSVST